MLNATGQAQHLLLLGGTSEIGLGIISEFLERGPAKVSLAARADSPHRPFLRRACAAASEPTRLSCALVSIQSPVPNLCIVSLVQPDHLRYRLLTTPALFLVNRSLFRMRPCSPTRPRLRRAPAPAPAHPPPPRPQTPTPHPGTYPSHGGTAAPGPSATPPWTFSSLPADSAAGAVAGCSPWWRAPCSRGAMTFFEFE